MNQEHKFPYRWYLKDGYPAQGIAQHSKKVFGTFICGGGSTMGYKLAGYTHLGGVEIDKEVAQVYNTNHHPKYLYNEDIRDFVKRTDMPEELYNLDLLDGSPPCSSFSMAGNREKDWNKNKVFREGQADQKLDDLFFTYIELAKKLQPKIVLAENVKGLIQGNAKFYVSRIKKEFEQAGYKVQLFLLNAASMGVPQKRERVFFICQRNDLKLPELKLDFSEKEIQYSLFKNEDEPYHRFTEHDLSVWNRRKRGDKDYGETLLREEGRQSNFSSKYIYDEQVPNTIVSASGTKMVRFSEAQYLTNSELKMIGSYPLDYNFINIEPKYLIGMSVPPVMTAQIANQINIQWLSKT